MNARPHTINAVGDIFVLIKAKNNRNRNQILSNRYLWSITKPSIHTLQLTRSILKYYEVINRDVDRVDQSSILLTILPIWSIVSIILIVYCLLKIPWLDLALTILVSQCPIKKDNFINMVSIQRLPTRLLKLRRTVQLKESKLNKNIYPISKRAEKSGSRFSRRCFCTVSSNFLQLNGQHGNVMLISNDNFRSIIYWYSRLSIWDSIR